MKPAIVPVACIEPVQRDVAHEAFIARALASRALAQVDGNYRSSAAVLKKLETRLAERRRKPV